MRAKSGSTWATRGILRSLEPKKTDVQMLHRNSPRLWEMLGEDDWFDKMSAAGRDHVRFAYMQQLLAYTEKQKRAILAGAGAQNELHRPRDLSSRESARGFSPREDGRAQAAFCWMSSIL